ncbi:MAG TPA: hypothetical protein VEL03_14480 [Streptosporangiaceae bacterium]|nr:hypothetical protein [Streptosporangiaceae bacterium]
MPRIEQLRHSVARMALRLRLAFAFLSFRLVGRLLPRQRSVLFFPLAVGLAVASIVFAAKSSSGPDCGQLPQASAIAAHAHGGKTCKPDMEPLGFGH